jgi:type IV secretion system protein TrbJ
MRTKFFLILFLFSSKAFSFVVFDPSNFIQNSLTASQTAQQIIYTISKYETQLLQYESQLKQLSSLDAGSIQILLNSNSIDSNNLNVLKNSLINLYGSLSDIANNFNQRLESAQYLGLNWNQYAQFEQDRIGRNQAAAISSANHEIISMERATRDYKFALDIEAMIPKTNGIHESLQLLNTQVNRMLTQNADLIQFLSQSSAGSSNLTNIVDKNSEELSILNIQKRNMALNVLRYQGELNLKEQLGSGYLSN